MQVKKVADISTLNKPSYSNNLDDDDLLNLGSYQPSNLNSKPLKVRN